MAGLVNTARLSARVAGRYANNTVARRGEQLSTSTGDLREMNNLY